MTARILIALTLVASLAGCGLFGGDDAEPADVAKPPPAATKGPPVYESAPLPSASFFER